MRRLCLSVWIDREPGLTAEAAVQFFSRHVCAPRFSWFSSCSSCMCLMGPVGCVDSPSILMSAVYCCLLVLVLHDIFILILIIIGLQLQILILNI